MPRDSSFSNGWWKKLKKVPCSQDNFVPKSSSKLTHQCRAVRSTFAVRAPLKPLRVDSVLRALSTLRGLRGAPEVPPLCRETQSLGQQMLNAPFGINGLEAWSGHPAHMKCILRPGLGLRFSSSEERGEGQVEGALETHTLATTLPRGVKVTTKMVPLTHRRLVSTHRKIFSKSYWINRN